MSCPLYVIDAFTAVPFCGNPAAVCVLDQEVPDEWLQNVAAEMNLSETAFLLPQSEGSYRLRWFTPTVEVDLCGHATLASAHVLWQSGRLPREQQAVFQTRSGVLQVDNEGDWITLDFPKVVVGPSAVPVEAFCQALGVPATGCWQAGDDYLVEVTNDESLRAVVPDRERLEAIGGRGVIVTCGGVGEWDFFSRFFAPNAGILEDPVTGSAHCALGPFWAERLGQVTLNAQQISARGGELKVKVGRSRVAISGQAVTVSEGQLWVNG